MTRFLIDAQLPPALARWIAGQGHEAEHVGDCGLAAAPDSEIWDYAVQSGAVIVTKDEDFAQRRIISENGPRVVWIRIPNTRRAQLLVWFGRTLPYVLKAIERGEVLIEFV